METKEKETKKKKYGLGALVVVGIVGYLVGDIVSWRQCNENMVRKEQEYLRRGYLTEEQINEVWDSLFGA